MNKNVLIVLGGAVLVAFLVALLVQMSMGGNKPAPVQEVKSVKILVAAKDLKTGADIKEGDTAWKSWPETAIFPGAVLQQEDQKAFEALTGRLKQDVAAGEPMLSLYILGNREGNVVANVLPEGMRAVSIGVSAESMVAGFLKPGDHVDVVLTYRAAFNSDDTNPKVQEMLARNLDRMAAETILQNVKVLAVDQMAGKESKEDAKVGRTVTLAVGREDAEKLALASEMGKLRLILRGLGDDNAAAPDWPTTTDKRMTKIEDEIFTEYKKMKKDTGINPDIVRIYSGGSVSSTPTQ